MKNKNQGLRGAADKAWLLYRDIIISKYVDEDLPLKEVMRLVEAEYGFRSTLKVYKTKINEWGVQKYLTFAQRIQAVQTIDEFVSRHGYTPRVTLNGKPVPLARLRRHSSLDKNRTKPRRSSISNGSKRGSDHDVLELSQLISDSNCATELVDTPLAPTLEWMSAPSFDSANIEKLLRCVLTFTSFCMDTYLSPKATLSTGLGHNIQRNEGAAGTQFWSSIITALNEFERGRPIIAFAELGKASQTATTFMRKPCISMFRYLLIVFGNDRWEQFNEPRQHMIVYLALMARAMLGSMHPVAMALAEIHKQDTLSTSAELMMRLATSEVEARLGPAHIETLWFKRVLARILRRKGQARTAETLLQNAKKQCAAATGPCSLQTRVCLEGLGQLYMQEGKLEEAEGTLVELVRKAENSSSDCRCLTVATLTFEQRPADGTEYIALFATRNLCFLAQARSDMTLQAYWYAKELAMIKQYGLDEDWMLGTRKYQEKKFFETGKFKYTTQLKGYIMPVDNRPGTATAA